MTTPSVLTALCAFALSLSAPLANAQADDAWFVRADGSIVDEVSGIVCPSMMDGYQRVETASYDQGGFCAYEANASSHAFTVQFYQASGQDTEAELVRTLSHFEDHGAVASMSNSVGCEANMASIATGGSSIAQLAKSFTDYEVDSDLRCLVLEDADASTWVISLQRAEGYFVSTISSSPNGSAADLSDMVDAASRFHAAQFAGPSV